MWNVLNRFTISFADMAFGRSVVLHVSSEIQKNHGISEVAQQLLRALDAQKIDAVQFLKSDRVRVTCKTAEYRDDLLEGSTFLAGDVPIPVTAADQSIRFVFVRDLPFEVPDDDVKSVFERFGVAHSISPCFFRDFPSVSNGTRRLVISFREAIPSSVSVVDFPVRAFHAGQPVICSVCHESGHLPRACPFSGLFLRCKQPGHVARNCTKAWGPSSSSSSPPVSTSSVPVSTSQSTSSTTVPSTSVSSALSAPVPSVQSQSQVLSEAFLEDREIAESSEAGASSSLSSSVTPVTVQSTPVAVSSVSPPTAVSPVSCGSAAPRDEDVSVSSELSVAGASSPRPAVSPRPPRTSSADFKRLIRLVVPKIKLGSDVSFVKKQCVAIAKSHKLNVSAEECSRIASSVCSGNTPCQMIDLFPDDYVIQVRNSFIEELNKVPAVQYIDVAVFSVSLCLRTPFLLVFVLQSLVRYIPSSIVKQSKYAFVRSFLSWNF